MQELIDKLKAARETAASARERKREIIEAAQATDEYKNADRVTNMADAEIQRLEETIRNEALTEFAFNGTKKPHEAVTIKMFKTVTVKDEAQAREWCFTNFRPALKLDAKVFESAVKDGNIPAELATVKDEPRAQIATKL